MSELEIVVDGRIINFEILDLDILTVDYYPENPRINYIISKYQPSEVNSDLIESALLSRDTTKELIGDIEKNGGLLEPIIVLGNKVIEGNTRLCAYRRLYKRTKDPMWKKIKSYVITDSLSNKEIFSILSNFHIKGKVKWDLYEKAACINKMVEQGLSVDDVAKEIRSNKPKVENMLKAYKVMRDNYLNKATFQPGKINDGAEELKKFSYFEAFYINKNLSDRIEKTPGFLDEFVDWVKEGRIPKAQDVREIHNILENKNARKIFLESDPETAHEEALEKLYWSKPGKIDSFYKRLEQFRELIRDSNTMKIRSEVQNNPNMKNVVQKCYKDLQKFCKEIGIN